MTTAEVYVTAAFLVVLAVVLLWLVIYAFKMRRLENEVDELERGEPAPRERVGTPRVVPAVVRGGADGPEGNTATEEPAEPVG